jgi:hemerythrin-like metal-binding protein
MNLERFQHYKLGHEIIDAEHFEIMLVTEEAMLASKVRDMDALNESVIKIANLCQRHFIHEEALMDKINYPFKDWHKKVHTLISGQLIDMFNRYSQNGNAVQAHISLMRDLETIIAHHIDETDRQLVEYLNK